MSLITNEIHILDGFRKTILIFAADRRISKPDGSFDSVRRKLFEIPYLDGGVSYFGLATVYPNGRLQYLSDWLPSFISRSSGVRTFEEFAYRLRNELSTIVPPNVLRSNPSGFHICGYNSAGIPEFWFLTNIGGMDEYRYTGLQPLYATPSPDFLGRDAKTLGWDGSNLKSVRNNVWAYRNGDSRVQASIWGRMDAAFNEIARFGDFKKLKTADDLREWVRFRFETTANFYKKFARAKIIGGPIDVLCKVRNLA